MFKNTENCFIVYYILEPQKHKKSMSFFVIYLKVSLYYSCHIFKSFEDIF